MPNSPPSQQRAILVTGGTSGIGLACCRALVRQANTHVIVIGPNHDRLDATVAALQQRAVKTSSVEGRCTDLAELASVRVLVEALIAEKTRLFALVCNAAVAAPPERTTPDGFETTFATNHLGHFLLALSLFHGGAFVDQDDARIVIVSAQLQHAPVVERYHPIQCEDAPDVSDWEGVAHGKPEQSPHAAYLTSKLCNQLFAHEFRRRYGDQLPLFIYAPGFVPKTGLFRFHSRRRWRWIRAWLKVSSVWDSDLRHETSTPQYSGAFLARLASECDLPFDNGAFISIDRVTQPCEQSRDRDLACQLWERSMRWIST